MFTRYAKTGGVLVQVYECVFLLQSKNIIIALYVADRPPLTQLKDVRNNLSHFICRNIMLFVY